MSETYDAVTYIHWLYWRLRCFEASGQDFQHLFEDIAARCSDDFVPIRPYGRLGDRKCDGLYWAEGTVYQVYSPDEMKEAETRAKIQKDLSGAVEHWGGALKRWVFVYNVRRGLPPDVVRLLQDQQQRYPNLVINPMSNDDLWKIVSKLPTQDRVEILGPPPSYEDLFPLTTSLPREVEEHIQNSRLVVIQDILSPINIADAIAALRPRKPFGPPLFIRPSPTSSSWEEAAECQRTLVEEALSRSRDQLPGLAVFSLSPIPLAAHLGFVLSDRVEVDPFQFDRNRKTWKWDLSAHTREAEFATRGIPKSVIRRSVEVVLRVSLSAQIRREETVSAVGREAIEIDMSVDTPDILWLVSAHQFSQFGRSLRSLLSEIRRAIPKCKRIHLFYAGPTGGAIIAGQAINPRMDPPVVLYEYDRRREPRYSPVLTLT